MSIYVDDIVITGSSQEAIDKLIQRLSTDFAIKDLGTLHYFLGVETRHDEKGLILTQHKYMIDLLHRTNMQDCKPISTPMAATERLSREGGTTLDET